MTSAWKKSLGKRLCIVAKNVAIFGRYFYIIKIVLLIFLIPCQRTGIRLVVLECTLVIAWPSSLILIIV